MTKPHATCELWISGQRIADNAGQMLGGFSTALDALKINWGRENVTDQPEPSTCSFSILTPAESTDTVKLLERLHVGSTVEVWSVGPIVNPKPTVTETYDDPTMSSYPPGNINTSLYGWSTTNAYTSPVSVAQHGKALQSFPADIAAVPPSWGIETPPRKFSPASTLPDAWDTIPRMRVGQAAWTITVQVAAPVGTLIRVNANYYSAPYHTTSAYSNGSFYTATGQWQSFERKITPGAQSADKWLGISVEVFDLDTITWQDEIGSWDAHLIANPITTYLQTWYDYATTYIDNPSATFPSGTENERRLLAFSGAVTDVVARPVDDGLLLDATAADMLADLANRVVGDDPWPVQPMATRFARVVTLAGLTSGTTRIDTPLDVIPVSYRDADAQPAASLLADLAQTVGGVLWAATHAVTGPFLWVENTDTRAAIKKFTMINSQAVIIGASRGVSIISACDLLREPVKWEQAVSDVITTVSVQWLEQGVDDDGMPMTTERYTTLTDQASQDLYGRFRLSIGTELTTDAAAQTLASRALAMSKSTGWRMSGLTMDTALVQETGPIGDAQRQQALLDLLDGSTRMGIALTLIDLPPYSPRGSTMSAYVDGGTYTFDGGSWVLDLNITPSSGQGESAPYNGFTNTYQWGSFNNVSWTDAYGTAKP